jgi:hypothetical protein
MVAPLIIVLDPRQVIIGGNMRRCFASFAMIITIFCTAFVDADAQPIDSTSHLRAEYAIILQKWLAHKKGLRLATENDVANKKGLEYARREDKDYYPYYAVGDFNQDGAQDFAVALANRDSSLKNFTVAIFNGPFKSSKESKPAFLSDRFDTDWWFFVDTEDEKQILGVGVYETDFPLIFRPRKKGYEMDHP